MTTLKWDWNEIGKENKVADRRQCERRCLIEIMTGVSAKLTEVLRSFSFSQRIFHLIQVLLHLSQSHPHIFMNTRWVHEANMSSVCRATGHILKPEDSQSCSPDPAKYVCTQADTSNPFPPIPFLYDPFDTILQSTPRSCKWLSSFWFLCMPFFPPIHGTHPPV